MAWKNSSHVELECVIDHFGPVTHIPVAHIVVWSIDDGVSCAEDFFIWQVDESITPGMGPSKEMEFHLSS